MKLDTSSVDSLFFQSAGGQCVALSLSGSPSVLFSPDGNVFYPLVIIDREHGCLGWKLSYCDPKHGKTGTITVIDKFDCIKVDGAVFTRVPFRQRIEVLPLSAVVPRRSTEGAELFVSSSTTNQKAVLYDGFPGGVLLYSPEGEIFREVPVGGRSYSGCPKLHNLSFDDAHDSCRRHNIRRHDDVMILDGDKIGAELCGPSDSVPFVIFDGRTFVLDNEALSLHRLTAEDVAYNKPGNIRCIKGPSCDCELVIGGTELRRISWCPSNVPFLRLPRIRKPEHLFQLADGQYVYVSSEKYSYSLNTVKLYIGTGDNMSERPVCGLASSGADGRSQTIWTGDDPYPLYIEQADSKEMSARWGFRKLTRLDPGHFDITETAGGVTITAKS